MRLDSFPRTSVPTAFTTTDLTVFSGVFEEILLRLIPTSRRVSLTIDFVDRSQNQAALNRTNEAGKGGAFSDGGVQKCGSDTFVLPFDHYGAGGLTAVIDGVDRTVFSRTSVDWLEDVATEAASTFMELKQRGTDPVTGCYTLTLLQKLLAGMAQDRDVQLILTESMPPARAPREAFAQIQKTAALLDGYDPYGFPLFHLGQSVFAMLILNRQRRFLKKYCLDLVSYLKQKGLRRVHCGSSSLLLHREGTQENRPVGERLLDEAWRALHAACKRGPFAFCDYDLLANPDHFPLQPPSRSAQARLRHRWRGLDYFALVLFSPDYLPEERLADLAADFFAEQSYVLAEGGLYLIRPGETAFQAKLWAAAQIKQIIARKDSGASLSVGIAQFPWLGFRRSETVMNCQKALLHGSFFGPGSATVFDAVSLNVSGDAYFGEGDLSSAVREYRRGLEVDPEDVNLLNSLGVAYAMMGRNREAHISFSAVLERDPQNFMALYNRGLGEQAAGDHGAAVVSLGRALSSAQSDPQESDQAGEDVSYRLAVSCFHCGDYQQTIDLLQHWHQQRGGSRRAGRYCRYLGLACYRLGRARSAVVWLQRAVVFDEFDAESISVLGALYFDFGEGEEVAFALLEKAVELDERNPENLLRYGGCLNRAGRYREARQVLGRCTRSPQTKYPAWMELLIACRGMKQYPKARYYQTKILAAEDIDSALQDQARESKL